MQALVLLGQDESLQLTRPLGTEAWGLPVGQHPSIELTLRWLERSAVSEAHLIIPPAGAQQLESYLEQAGWGSRNMAVGVLAVPGWHSEGEALRYVEQTDIVKGDFVLVVGCVVGSVDLLAAMQAHAIRRANDRQVLMTMLFREFFSNGLIGQPAAWVVVADSHTQQLLKLERGDRDRQLTSLGAHLFGDHDGVLVYTSLIPASVYICSPETLVLLSDNFDYQSITEDLITGVLSEQELGGTLYIHQFTRGYINCAGSRRNYTELVQAVTSRWTYPFVPDNAGDQRDACRFIRGSYMAASTSLALSSSVSKGTFIGAHSRVNPGALLNRCIVGTHCHIGTSAKLQQCCLHDHAKVEDGSTLSYAILGDHALLRGRDHLQMGALLAKHAVVDANHTVPAGACISIMDPQTLDSLGDGHETEDTVMYASSGHPLTATDTTAGMLASMSHRAQDIHQARDNHHDVNVVGLVGAGHVWPPAAIPVSQLATLVFPGFDEREASFESGSEMEDFGKDGNGTEDVECGAPSENADDVFKEEVVETFLRCIKERISHENAAIELNGLKIAEDRTFADCARYIFITLLSICIPPSPCTKQEYRELFHPHATDLTSTAGRRELLQRLDAQLTSWKGLLIRFLKSNDEQVELLLTLEEYCSEEDPNGGWFYAKLFPQVVKLCYDHDVLSEEAIFEWAKEKEDGDADDRRFVEMCMGLLTWLEDAEEESSDADSDGSA